MPSKKTTKRKRDTIAKRIGDYELEGSNITLTPGSGTPNGSIIMKSATGDELLRFDPNGKAFVRGQLVDCNVEIYGAFRYWLIKAYMTFTKTDMVISSPGLPPEERKHAKS